MPDPLDWPVVAVTPSSNASQRTKNRIREHGPQFELLNTGYPPALNGDKSHYLRALNENGWFGWIPVAEVELALVSDLVGRFEKHLEPAEPI